MAITIITASQLREQLGGMTKFRHAIDHIDDATLQAIIDHHTSAFTDFVYQKSKVVPLPEELFVAQTVTISASTDSNGLKEAALPANKFPATTKALYNGIPFQITSDVQLLAKTAAWDFYGIEVTAAKIYVAAPAAVTAVSVWLADADTLIKRIASEELTATRSNILKEGAKAVEARIAISQLQQSDLNQQD